MIIEILETLFLVLTILMTAYLIRHYVFTLTVLRNDQKRKNNIVASEANYQPSVSILIPARNEERVIERLLQRMIELTYPKNKMEVIIIDDASTDNTGKIAEQYSKTHDYIRVIHRNENEGGKGKAQALNLESSMDMVKSFFASTQITILKKTFWRNLQKSLPTQKSESSKAESLF